MLLLQKSRFGDRVIAVFTKINLEPESYFNQGILRCFESRDRCWQGTIFTDNELLGRFR